jgi:hypothetical protein
MALVLQMGVQPQEVLRSFKYRPSVQLPVDYHPTPSPMEVSLRHRHLHSHPRSSISKSPTTLAWFGLLVLSRQQPSAILSLQPFSFLQVLQVLSHRAQIVSHSFPRFLNYPCAGVGLRLLIDSNNDLVVTGTSAFQTAL